jgi:hypothetical protein
MSSLFQDPERPVLAFDLDDLRPEDTSTVRSVFEKLFLRLNQTA